MMKTINTIVLALLIVGGLNWLLVGIFDFDLVAYMFGGQDTALSRFIYIVVGICAIYSFRFFNNVTDVERAR